MSSGIVQGGRAVRDWTDVRGMFRRNFFSPAGRARCFRSAVGFLSAVVVSTGLAPASASHVAPAPQTVTAIVPANFPPQYSLDRAGVPTGFAIDVMEALAARTNLKVRYIVKDSWPLAVDAFRAGEGDLIPNMGITEERKQYGSYTAPIETFNVSVFVRTTTKFISKLADLAGRDVGVVKINVAETILSDRPEIRLHVYGALPDLFYSLVSGQIDALAYPEPVLWEFAGRAGNENMIKVVGAPLAEIKRAVWVRPGRPELLESLDAAIRDFVGGAEYSAIFDKWHGKPPVYWTALRVLTITGGIGAAIIVGIVFLSHFSLRKMNRSLIAASVARDAAEAELRVNEQKYQSLFHDSPVAHLVVAPADGAILNCNPAAARLTGYPVDDLRRMTVLELPPNTKKDRAEAEFLLKDVANGTPIETADVALKRRDGSVIRIGLSVNPIVDDVGDVVELRAVLTDITALKRAEDEIRASEGRFQALTEQMPTGILRGDADGKAVYVNEAWCTQTGFTPAQGLGDGWLDAVHPDDRSLVANTWRTAIADRKPGPCEFRWRHGDGRAVRVIGQSVPELGGDGQPIGVVCSFTDVTEIQELQTRLTESEQRFALAMRGDSDGLWDWNLISNEVYFSPRWKEMLGYGDDEVTNDFNEWERRLHPDDVEPTVTAIQAHIKGETETFRVEFRMRHKDGHWVDILGRGFIAHDDAGTPIRFVGTHVDISKLKQQERELLRLNKIRETISRCNSVLVKAKTEEDLLNKMCEILTTLGGFPLAWIGFAETDADKTVRPVAMAGPAVPYLDDVTVRWGDDEYGRGPSGTAIRTGRVQVKPNLAADSAFRPWAEAAAKWSLRSAISMPLMDESGPPFGTLCVFSTEPNAFDDVEVAVLTEFANDLAFGVRSIRARDDRVRAQEQVSTTLLGTIDAIARTVEKRDPYTAGHQRRVAELAAAIASAMGWSPDRINGLRLGATIHDIGKIYIPAEILNRPGALSNHEFGMIKTHPEVGHDIVSGVQFPWPVTDMILQHHERLDGSGYPNGLKGDAIVEEARILAVADVVEAITAHRPYRPALGVERGLEEIRRGRGAIYDPSVVDACVQVFAGGQFKWEGV